VKAYLVILRVSTRKKWSSPWWWRELQQAGVRSLVTVHDQSRVRHLCWRHKKRRRSCKSLVAWRESGSAWPFYIKEINRSLRRCRSLLISQQISSIDSICRPILSAPLILSRLEIGHPLWARSKLWLGLAWIPHGPTQPCLTNRILTCSYLNSFKIFEFETVYEFSSSNLNWIQNFILEYCNAPIPWVWRRYCDIYM